jgi:hypothetical protein
MANIAGTFGQTFLMFPMVGKGQGVARGVETSVDAKPFAGEPLPAVPKYS